MRELLYFTGTQLPDAFYNDIAFGIPWGARELTPVERMHDVHASLFSLKQEALAYALASTLTYGYGTPFPKGQSGLCHFTN